MTDKFNVTEFWNSTATPVDTQEMLFRDMPCMVQEGKQSWVMDYQCMYEQGINLLSSFLYKMALYLFIIIIINNILTLILKLRCTDKLFKSNPDRYHSILKIANGLWIVDYALLIMFLLFCLAFGWKQGVYM